MSQIRQSYILTITCPAASGVVARVSNFLFESDFYILSMEQFDNEKTGKFFCRIHFRADKKETSTLAALRNAFSSVAQQDNMQWKIVDTKHAPRVLIMVSKPDHCLQDLLYRNRKGVLNMEITSVISNHQTLRKMVEDAGIPFVYLPMDKDKSNKAEQEVKMLSLVAEQKVELVILARYMQVLSEDTCKALAGRCINIHHSFLPGFKGANPYHRAYDRGVKIIGATAHYVTPDLDEGPIIEQAVEIVDHRYNPADLVAMGRDIESRALARAVRWHIEHRVFIDKHKTVVFK